MNRRSPPPSPFSSSTSNNTNSTNYSTRNEQFTTSSNYSYLRQYDLPAITIDNLMKYNQNKYQINQIMASALANRESNYEIKTEIQETYKILNEKAYLSKYSTKIAELSTIYPYIRIANIEKNSILLILSGLFLETYFSRNRYEEIGKLAKNCFDQYIYTNKSPIDRKNFENYQHIIEEKTKEIYLNISTIRLLAYGETISKIIYEILNQNKEYHKALIILMKCLVLYHAQKANNEYELLVSKIDCKSIELDSSIYDIFLVSIAKIFSVEIIWKSMDYSYDIYEQKYGQNWSDATKKWVFISFGLSYKPTFGILYDNSYNTKFNVLMNSISPDENIDNYQVPPLNEDHQARYINSTILNENFTHNKADDYDWDNNGDDSNKHEKNRSNDKNDEESTSTNIKDKREDNNEDICCLCSGSYLTNLVFTNTNCLHKFCIYCIKDDKYFKMRYKCPYQCREELDKDLLTIFLEENQKRKGNESRFVQANSSKEKNNSMMMNEVNNDKVTCAKCGKFELKVKCYINEKCKHWYCPPCLQKYYLNSNDSKYCFFAQCSEKLDLTSMKEFFEQSTLIESISQSTKQIRCNSCNTINTLINPKSNKLYHECIQCSKLICLIHNDIVEKCMCICLQCKTKYAYKSGYHEKSCGKCMKKYCEDCRKFSNVIERLCNCKCCICLKKKEDLNKDEEICQNCRENEILCYNCFDECITTPKIKLECKHQICQTCIFERIESKNNREKIQKGMKIVLCPICIL